MKVEYRSVFFSYSQGRVVAVEDHATRDRVAVINAAEFDAFMEAHNRLVDAVNNIQPEAMPSFVRSALAEMNALEVGDK